MPREDGAIVVGAALVAGAGALLWGRRRANAAPAAAEVAPPPSVLPTPLFDLGRPVSPDVHALVTSGWSRTRDHGPHRALDIHLAMRTPVTAIDDGEVIRVVKSDNSDAGRFVAVRHGSGLVSRYLHFDETRVELHQQVRRGGVLGLSGNSGNSAAPHLHLDLHVPPSMLARVAAAIGMPSPSWGPNTERYGCAIPGEPFVPVDEYRASVIRDAKRAGIPLRLRNRVRASVVFLAPPLRNGALVYRPVGSPGERYPTWVRALKGESGVYVIRERGAIVYVGESHTKKLYETLTRHFQIWRRWKGFWRGHYGEGHDPGLTYQRERVEVAVRVLPSNRAIDEETRLIRRLKPRDNLIGQPELEEAPF